jgi:hypothetical protein
MLKSPHAQFEWGIDKYRKPLAVGTRVPKCTNHFTIAAGMEYRLPKLMA